MRIGVLAVQGAFAEQEKKLQELGVSYIEIRQKKDLDCSLDGLILPGGESTVMGKLLRDLDLLEELKNKIDNGLPVLATCAGLILLANEIEGENLVHLGTMPITVIRNAYGRQLGSFHIEQEMKEIGNVPMTFIRAPYVKECSEEVEILAKVEERIVAVKYKNQLGLSFHPELDENNEIHQYFIKKMCQ